MPAALIREWLKRPSLRAAPPLQALPACLPERRLLVRRQILSATNKLSFPAVSPVIWRYMLLVPLAANTSVKGDLTVKAQNSRGLWIPATNPHPRVVFESGKNAHYRLSIEDTKVRT